MKELKFGLIVLFVSIMIVGILIGITLDTVLTDIRNLKENEVYWLRNQVEDTQDKVDKLLERQRYDHETDLAYQTELAKTMTKNDEYFDGLLGNIEIDIWLLRQSEHYSNEEILKRIGIVIENTRQKTFDELMEEAMSEVNE